MLSFIVYVLVFYINITSVMYEYVDSFCIIRSGPTPTLDFIAKQFNGWTVDPVKSDRGLM